MNASIGERISESARGTSLFLTVYLGDKEADDLVDQRKPVVKDFGRQETAAAVIQSLGLARRTECDTQKILALLTEAATVTFFHIRADRPRAVDQLSRNLSTACIVQHLAAVFPRQIV